MATMEDIRFAKKVKKALVDRDMSQKELALAIGTSHKYLNHILNLRKPPGKYEESIRSILGLKTQSKTLHAS